MTDLKNLRSGEVENQNARKFSESDSTRDRKIRRQSSMRLRLIRILKVAMNPH